MAVGLQDRQTASELISVAEMKKEVIKQVLKAAITSLPKTRSCVCAHALEHTQL
jgi:hypothetical protein